MLQVLSKKCIIPVALITIFSLISAVCLIMHGDDFIWYYVYDIEELFPFQNPNGRYFTNQITYLMVKFPLMRYIIFSGVLSSLIILTAHMMDYEKKSGVMKYCLTFSLFVLMPGGIYLDVINWISGFTNYTISTLFSLIYIFYCFKILFDKNYIPSKIWLVSAAILGFLGALCVENMTIYNILLGIFSIIIIFKFRKRVFASNILYLITSVIGFIIMLSSEAYSELLYQGEKDLVGERHIEIAFSDIFMQIYRLIVSEYSKPFFVVHILLALCFAYLYYRADKNNWSKSTKRYSKICIYSIALYAVYSLFVNCFADLEVFDMSMKIRALETAFVFVYLLSLVYLAFILFERNKFLRITVYLVSTVIVIAPFVIVNPVTPRCFFADAVFWILVSGELFFACYEKTAFFRSSEMKKVFCAVSILAGVFMCNINISNKIWENIRIDYIREQINENERVIKIISLPYSNYNVDNLTDEFIFNCYFTDNLGYTELLFLYYDIDVDKDNFKYINIGVVDYNIE